MIKERVSKMADFVPLTSVLSFIVDNRGKSVPTSKSGIKLIATNCIKENRLYPVYENIRYISQETYDIFFRSHIKPNDILFVNKGVPGKVAVVPQNLDFEIAQDAIGLRSDESKIYWKYLYYQLKTKRVQKIVENNNVGLMIPHFKKEFLERITIDLKEPHLQKKIGDLLFSIDSKIDLNIKKCELLERIAEDYFDRWFIQFDFLNENRKPFKANGGHIVVDEKTKIGIPDGWRLINIRELCSLVWGQCPDGKNILPLDTNIKNTLLYCSGAGDMRNGLVVDCQARTDESRREAEAGDILMSVAGSIGALCICDKHISLGRAAVAFRPKPNDLAFCYFMIKKFIGRMMSVSTGSIQKVINDSNINDINFAYNQSIVRRFEFANKMIKRCICLSQENVELTKLKEELLVLLMNGQATID